ncbi:MAG: hypothetical protein FWC77_03635 [Defluviitaleaceae bacterium]|nr:hypothetical protein [Defluviitaleaceae bacterium]
MHVLVIALVVIGVLAIFLELLMPGWDSYIGVFVGIAAFAFAAGIAVIAVDGAIYFVGAIVALLVAGGYGLYFFIKKRQLHGGMILTDVDDAPQVDVSGFLGKEGKTVTLLRPSGDVDFNGVRMQASSDGPFIERGVKVRVTETQANKLIVRVVGGN